MLYILNLIFEREPEKRISIPELRNLIIGCPRFTMTPMTPSLPTSPLLDEQHTSSETSSS
jgi:hypothetical protein